MPYGRYSRRSRRRGRGRFGGARRSVRKRYRGRRRLPTRAFVHREIRKHHETKIADYDTVGNEEASTTILPYHLTGLAQGTAHDNRDGDKIYLKSCKLKMMIQRKIGAIWQQAVKLVVVQIFNHNDDVFTTMAWTDFFEQSPTDHTAMLPTVKWHMRKRFAVLGTKLIHFKPVDDQNSDRRYITWNIPIKRKTLLYDAGTAVTVPDNALWLLTLGTEPSGNTSALINAIHRIKYYA